MILQDLLKVLKSYKKIVISGPQRSGTTIATAIIAKELRYTPFFEESFNVTNLQKFFAIYTSYNSFVIQAPAISPYLNAFPKSAVIFMMRPTCEIINSEKRIQWIEEKAEKSRYFLSEDQRCISVIKYNIWNQYQKHLPDRFELEYKSLQDHPLWINEQERKQFGPRQISIQDT